MSLPRSLWRRASALTVGVAVIGTVLAVPLGPILGLSISLAVLGATLAWALAEDLPPGVRHPIPKAAALCVTPALVPGLLALLGPAAIGLVVLLVITSPWSTSRVVRFLRGRLLPSQLEAAATAPPGDGLRRQWEGSNRLLEGASTAPERLKIIELREQILEDILRDSAGDLPDYVWPHHGGRGQPVPGS